MAKKDEEKFGKEALLKHFEADATLLNILLADGQSYSVAEVEKIMDEWRKGVVK